jgi:hypothetical protein
VLATTFCIAAYDPKVFKAYLDTNRMIQCTTRPDEPPMPISFYATNAYFDGIPLDQRVPPNSAYTQPMIVPACNHQLIQPDALNAYEFQTERFLTTIGLNIYDGAVHSIASAVLGEPDSAIQYETSIISSSKTCQFGDIRGDAPCKGVINAGECTDPNQGGACGFCYGAGSNADRSVAKTNAWSFRMISDYWALQGTVDARCPALNMQWTWNDYRPILGENAWAYLTGPLQVAYLKYGSVTAIPNNDMSITLGLNFLPSVTKMITSVGAVSYSPKNTIGFNNSDSGYTVSTENQVSLLAGLKMLRYILTQKNINTDQIPVIDNIMTNIEGFIKSAYDPSVGFFRQGGSFNNAGAFSWNTGNMDFAVDCQTWTLSVLGPNKVDGWFGAGTSANIWATAKKLGGYNYLIFDGSVEGMGFSYNSNDQVFSGEWTFGTINMLRIMAKQLNNSSYTDEANSMRDNISQQLTNTITIKNVPCTGVYYANKRYYIPFGWWANPLLSTASTGWAVLVDSNFNPFYLGGQYQTDY